MTTSSASGSGHAARIWCHGRSRRPPRWGSCAATTRGPCAASLCRSTPNSGVMPTAPALELLNAAGTLQRSDASRFLARTGTGQPAGGEVGAGARGRPLDGIEHGAVGRQLQQTGPPQQAKPLAVSRRTWTFRPTVAPSCAAPARPSKPMAKSSAFLGELSDHGTRMRRNNVQAGLAARPPGRSSPPPEDEGSRYSPSWPDVREVTNLHPARNSRIAPGTAPSRGRDDAEQIHWRLTPVRPAGSENAARWAERIRPYASPP